MGVLALGEHAATFLAAVVAMVLVCLGFAGHQGLRDGLAVADLLRELLDHQVAFVLGEVIGLSLQLSMAVVVVLGWVGEGGCELQGQRGGTGKR